MLSPLSGTSVRGSSERDCREALRPEILTRGIGTRWTESCGRADTRCPYWHRGNPRDPLLGVNVYVVRTSLKDEMLLERGTFNMGKKCGEWIEDGETVTYEPCPDTEN